MQQDPVPTPPALVKREPASYVQRVRAHLLDALLPLPTLGVGYVIWWLFTLKNGQTPGKQWLKIKAIRENGQELGWGGTIVREFLIKGIACGIIGLVTLYVAHMLNLLWPLWDKQRQALHDKMAGTVVVAA